jgi:hypothetical protein
MGKAIANIGVPECGQHRDFPVTKPDRKKGQIKWKRKERGSGSDKKADVT